MAVVDKYKLWDGTLAPETSQWNTWNNISSSKALFFYVVPRIGQNGFPQTIEIEEVGIETTESAKWRARIKVRNPTAPKNIPQVDVCFYTMYMVTVA